jgi:hypothetical protein
MNSDEELDNSALNTSGGENADAVPDGENGMPQRVEHVLTPEARGEARATIAQWLFIREPFREPSTLKQLGKDLHIS